MKHFARGNILWLAAGGSAVRIALIDEGEDIPLDTDEFMSSQTANSREETSGNMTLIDAAQDGIIDANDVTLVATVDNLGGAGACEGVLMYNFVTNDADSRQLFYWNSGGGLPVTLGGDVTVAWDNGTNKIAKI
jgi:hypothetical protein